MWELQVRGSSFEGFIFLGRKEVLAAYLYFDGERLAGDAALLFLAENSSKFTLGLGRKRRFEPQRNVTPFGVKLFNRRTGANLPVSGVETRELSLVEKLLSLLPYRELFLFVRAGRTLFSTLTADRVGKLLSLLEELPAGTGHIDFSRKVLSFNHPAGELLLLSRKGFEELELCRDQLREV